MSGNTGLLHPGDIIGKPDQVVHVVLATGTSNAQAFDVPTGKGVLVPSFNTDFWMSYGSTAASIPSTSSTANTTSNAELNPGARYLSSTAACTGISIASEVACKGSLAWYSR